MRSDAPPSVLVVDDDASIRDLFVSVLRRAAAVRADGHTHDVPMLVVSGGGGAALARALVSGGSAVLAKPCSGRVLVAAVERLLDRSSASWPLGQQAQPASCST